LVSEERVRKHAPAGLEKTSLRHVLMQYNKVRGKGGHQWLT